LNLISTVWLAAEVWSILRARFSIAPNGLGQSVVGIKGTEEFAQGSSFVFKLETGFDPYSMQLANGPRSSGVASPTGAGWAIAQMVDGQTCHGLYQDCTRYTCNAGPAGRPSWSGFPSQLIAKAARASRPY